LPSYSHDVRGARRRATINKMRKYVFFLECFIQLIIFYSLIMYFIELEFCHTEHSRAGHIFFLWSERTVAGIFTIEYITRWIYSSRKKSYPFTPLAIIDLLAILPFYLGFLVDMRSLRLIRTLRILRIFKFYRYNEALRRITLTYYRVKDELYVLGGAILLLVFFSGTIIYEAEREVQPEMFTKYSDGIWWSIVTLTTVGYGDKYPITFTGRLTACITMIVGLGLFGSFISIMGSSFISTIKEKNAVKHVNISSSNMDHIRNILESSGKTLDENGINEVIEKALIRQPILKKKIKIPSLDVSEQIHNRR
jgi:voltage-gated potassium channel